MISINNLKLLEDLREEHERLTKELENLKIAKSQNLHEAAIIMLRRIQRFLEHNSLNVTEHNSAFEDGFVANYKKGYLRGVVSSHSHSIDIIYQGETIEIIQVIPRPTQTIYMQNAVVIDKDMLETQIDNIDAEIKNLKDEIKSYNQDNFIFATEIHNERIVLQNEDEVLDYLFK